MADRALFPDLTDAASDLSPVVSALLIPNVEFLGLSVLLPGILDLKALNDRIDSLVSALLKDGYDERSSVFLFNEVCDALLFGVAAPEPLEGWFPIVVGMRRRVFEGRGLRFRGRRMVYGLLQYLYNSL